jgi:galactonate dehydratase
MKITDLKTYVVMVQPRREWLFVELETDEGITGLGECSDYASTAHLVGGLEAIKHFVVGMDPRNIEDLWQKLFHGFSDLNGRGYVSHLSSALDIALWDIRGKTLGAPIYQLLGGPLRDRVPLYTHIPSPLGNPDLAVEVALEAARKAKDAGYQAIKTDPFRRQWQGAGPLGGEMVERLTPAEVSRAADWMMALREALGPSYELLVDAHARFDVASAIRACRALEPVKLVWLEEPVPVESVQALRQVRENTHVPLSVGERHFTRWDYVEIFKERLVDYVMPDVAWTGGISELRRIASAAEAHYIRFSPHDALGPVMLMAGVQVDMTVPNLYRQECVHEFFPDYARVLTKMFTVHDGAVIPDPEAPGLGVELDHEKIKPYLVSPFDSRIHRPFQFPSQTVKTGTPGRTVKTGARRTGRRQRT